VADCSDAAVLSEERYVSGAYGQANPDWHVEDTAWKAGRIVEMLRRNRVEPRSICDVGCGVGAILAIVRDALEPGSRCVGYDIAPGLEAVWRERADLGLEFRRARFPLADDERYDLVMAIDVIEHLDDYRGFLREVRARASLTLLHIPLDLSVQTVLRGKPLESVYREFGHIHFFTKALALRALCDVGYEILDWQYTRSAIELKRSGWRKRIAKGPRRALHVVSPDVAATILGGFSLLVLAR